MTTCFCATSFRKMARVSKSVSLALVHYRQQGLITQIAPQIFGEQGVMPLPQFVGQRRCVRSDQQIGHVPQRRISSQRLFRKNIERRTTNFLFPQSSSERGFVHELAAAYVDQTG